MIITREQGQSIVKTEYLKHKFLMVLYATGFGKGKAALDAVVGTLGLMWKGMIAVHSQPSRDTTWPTEIKEWYPHLLRDIGGKLKVECFHSLNKYEGEVFDFVIVDEGHYMTPNQGEFFRKNTVKSIIILTATEPEDPDKKRMLHKLCKEHIISISIDMAVKNKILNDYRIRVWKIEMTAMERSGYLEICKKMQMFRDKGNWEMLNIVGGERKKYIANLQSKYLAGKYLADQIRATKKRFIIFCHSIEMANRMSRYRFHSEVESDMYNAFCAGYINEIACVNQIQAGANIKALESALIQQIDSKGSSLLQKLGRLMRLDTDMLARMHLLVVDNSCDMDYLTKATKDIDKTKITYHKLDRELYDPSAV